MGDPLDGLVYARHGRELKGCKSPVREPCPRSGTLAEVLAEGKACLRANAQAGNMTKPRGWEIG